MGGNFLTVIGNSLTQLYAAQAGFFLATGLNIFWSIVVINIFLMGVDSFTGRLNEDHFVRKVAMILIVGALMGYYALPVPGVGVSFPHIFIDEAKTLSDQLESGADTTAQNALNQAVAQTEQPNSGIFPTIGGLVQAVWYLILIALVGLERVVLIGVLAISYIAIGVIVLVGPMFMPWVLFPGLEHIAWGWFNALLHYCFYQVVAGAVVFLNSILLFGFFNQHPLPWKIVDVPAIALEFLGVVGISIYVVTWVPRIAGSILSGAGGSAVKERAL